MTGNLTGNVTGNADTATTAGSVTNGVYSNGSYADPAWLTSLAGAKISGTVANATTAGSVTNGVYTNIANTITTGNQSIATGADANKGLIVKGHSATQSANLQEWQDSTTAVKASVSPTGVITGDGSGLTNLPAATTIGAGVITDANVNATAAIATSKLSGAVTNITGHGLGSLATKSTIIDADIDAGAAITDSKLATIAMIATKATRRLPIAVLIIMNASHRSFHPAERCPASSKVCGT